MTIMNVLLDFLGQGWVGTAIGAIGTLIGIAGLLFAIGTWMTSRVGARPVVQMRSLRIIGAIKAVAGDEVQVFYNGTRVPRLTRTHVIFWNSGRKTLYCGETVASDPIRFELAPDEGFVRARIVKTSRATNEFSVDFDLGTRSRVLCSFDYLDPGDGAIIELLHTSEEKYPQVLGTIRGVKNGIKHMGIYGGIGSPGLLHGLRLWSKLVSSRGFMWFTFGMVASATVRGLFWVEGERSMAYVGLFYLIVLGGILWSTRRKVPKNLVIEDLDGLD